MTDIMPFSDATDDVFHRLNNHLGIVLVNAELIEQRCPDAATRTRAADIVASALAALEAVKALRARPPTDPSENRR